MLTQTSAALAMIGSVIDVESSCAAFAKEMTLGSVFSPFCKYFILAIALPWHCSYIIWTAGTAATELYLYARVDPKATNFTAGNTL